MEPTLRVVPQKSLKLCLEISDAEVIAEIEKHPDDSSREKYALSALRLGVLALRQAAGELDATTIRNAAQTMLTDLGQMLSHGAADLTSELSSALRQYFDPTTGALPQRIDSLLRNDGELDRALRTHLASENSTIAQTLSAHFGEGSAIRKLLSPTEASGLKAQIENVLGTYLREQREQILQEFSLDHKNSALSRLVEELTSSNGELKNDIENKVRTLVNEFSLDKPDSALSRLVGRVESAQKAIASEFSADNENSAITRLSRMLHETSRQIDQNLTLDNDGSALSRLKRELLSTIQTLVIANNDFQSEVRATLAALQARKEEANRSTMHGHAFEDQVGFVVATEAQRLNDLYEAVGTSTGIIKNCKTGDFVSSLGPDSAAPGTRIVWEAKEDQSYDLKRALAELALARKNRQAQIGVFVFSSKTAPEALQPFARYGNDIVIRYDPDNVDGGLIVRVAYSVARALAIRENHETIESEQALRVIEAVAVAIEKQLDHLDQIKTWADTVRNNGEKIADRAARLRTDLAKEIEALEFQVNGLKNTAARAA